jgi:hypothetical protein
MIDHLANRQTAGLTDFAKLNAKLDALARYFDLGWLESEGSNPLQILWKSRDALATNELLNFGDAVENFEIVDARWVERQVVAIKTGDDGNRAGAIFELLGLNLFLSAGNKVVPSSSSNPGYDGVVELPDQSTLLVSIKNHGMTSYERFFQKKRERAGRAVHGMVAATRLVWCRIENSVVGPLRRDRMGKTQEGCS